MLDMFADAPEKPEAPKHELEHMERRNPMHGTLHSERQGIRSQTNLHEETLVQEGGSSKIHPPPDRRKRA